MAWKVAYLLGVPINEDEDSIIGLWVALPAVY
jgi:hypothetical protein